MPGAGGVIDVNAALDASSEVSEVQLQSGTEELKDAAESLVRSWVFRRTSPQRLYALAEVHYGMNGSRARIRPVP